MLTNQDQALNEFFYYINISSSYCLDRLKDRTVNKQNIIKSLWSLCRSNLERK